MNRTNIAAELAERLRREGVFVRPRALDAFVASLPDEAGDLDAEALIQRYLKRSRAYRWGARLSLNGPLFTWIGLMLFAFGLAAFADAQEIAMAEYRIDPGPLAYGMIFTPCGLGMAIYGTVLLVRLWNGRRTTAKPPDGNSRAAITDIRER